MKRSPTTSDDAEWYQSCYERVVADVRTQLEALKCAMSARNESDPAVFMTDVQASRAYLRACIFNMTVAEAAEKKDADFAALWGRGALGAARYRANPKLVRLKTRAKRAPDDDD